MRELIDTTRLERLARLLEERFHGKTIYSSPVVLHIEATEGMMGWIKTAKDDTETRLDYNVLIEYPRIQNGMKYVLHGSDFVCMQLAKRYGGRISNARYWILYDEVLNSTNHGYKKELPTLGDIITFIEKLY